MERVSTFLLVAFSSIASRGILGFFTERRRSVEKLNQEIDSDFRDEVGDGEEEFEIVHHDDQNKQPKQRNNLPKKELSVRD